LRRSDIISGSLLVLAGLLMIFVIVPQQIASSSDYGLDPAFFPLALLWLIVAMAVLLVATRIPQPPDPPEEEPVLDRWNWGFIVGASLFFLLGFIAIEQLGFVIAGTLMIAVLMFALELRGLNWIEVIGIAAIAPFSIYWLLYHVFSVQLPSGVLFP
jgi:hypothetical protein